MPDSHGPLRGLLACLTGILMLSHWTACTDVHDIAFDAGLTPPDEEDAGTDRSAEPPPPDGGPALVDVGVDAGERGTCETWLAAVPRPAVPDDSCPAMPTTPWITEFTGDNPRIAAYQDLVVVAETVPYERVNEHDRNNGAWRIHRLDASGDFVAQSEDLPVVRNPFMRDPGWLRAGENGVIVADLYHRDWDYAYNIVYAIGATDTGFGLAERSDHAYSPPIDVTIGPRGQRLYQSYVSFTPNANSGSGDWFGVSEVLDEDLVLHLHVYDVCATQGWIAADSDFNAYALRRMVWCSEAIVNGPPPLPPLDNGLGDATVSVEEDVLVLASVDEHGAARFAREYCLPEPAAVADHADTNAVTSGVPLLYGLDPSDGSERWRSAGVDATGSFQPKYLEVDSQGTSYVVADFSGSVTPGSDAITAFGARSTLVAAYSRHGNFCWAHQVATSPSSGALGFAVGGPGKLYVLAGDQIVHLAAAYD